MQGLPERLRSRITPEGECWMWTGATGERYGRFYVGRDGGKARWRGAHRVVYEALVGPVPSGLELDHLCRNRLCVNPIHLEPVTHQENCRRGRVGKYLSERTHCKHGHPFSGDNLIVLGAGLGRRCRACRRVINRRSYAKQAAT